MEMMFPRASVEIIPVSVCGVAVGVGVGDGVRVGVDVGVAVATGVGVGVVVGSGAVVGGGVGVGVTDGSGAGVGSTVGDGTAEALGVATAVGRAAVVTAADTGAVLSVPQARVTAMIRSTISRGPSRIHPLRGRSESSRRPVNCQSDWASLYLRRPISGSTW